MDARWRRAKTRLNICKERLIDLEDGFLAALLQWSVGLALGNWKFENGKRKMEKSKGARGKRGNAESGARRAGCSLDAVPKGLGSENQIGKDFPIAFRVLNVHLASDFPPMSHISPCQASSSLAHAIISSLWPFPSEKISQIGRANQIGNKSNLQHLMHSLG